jgi:hypothetical protein
MIKCRNVKINTPKDYQGSAELSVKSTYLDTIGRPTITLKVRTVSPVWTDEIQVLLFLTYC